ncbi:hypothetical protein BD31_I1613 [Candidatus Nitrosopumilus salaria BD31]|uniref:Uncharacterized protein n=1 Tax=Candidatus Nitrosopumilus salarius BD31 TaxID=859350 RepID=I3D358_9ARCH|nr:hypothetical protein BD31_I1613 [Candidatus Nitrosopumilus salaria BD31]
MFNHNLKIRIVISVIPFGSDYASLSLSILNLSASNEKYLQIPLEFIYKSDNN